MHAILGYIFISYRIAWPLFLFWVYEVPQYLPLEWRDWLTINANPLLLGAFVGSVIWIILMIFSERSNAKAIYHKYIRPRIKFILTDDREGAQFERIDNKLVLSAINLYFEGYFQNDGGSPSVVTRIETQLFKKYWILSIPIGRPSRAAYYAEGTNGIVDSIKGFDVREFSVSKKIKADSTCSLGGKDIEKKFKNHFIRIRWHVIGQEFQDTEIYPDWDLYRNIVASSRSRPIWNEI